MSMEKPSLIVYGHSGSGKTRLAPQILKHYGLGKIVDEWNPSLPMPMYGALVLTSYIPYDLAGSTEAQLEARRKRNMKSIEEVKKELGVA